MITVISTICGFITGYILSRIVHKRRNKVRNLPVLYNSRHLYTYCPSCGYYLEYSDDYGY